MPAIDPPADREGERESQFRLEAWRCSDCGTDWSADAEGDFRGGKWITTPTWCDKCGGFCEWQPLRTGGEK
jgi:hypothetical protein